MDREESKEEKRDTQSWYQRHDVLVFIIGHVFIGVIIAAIVVLGMWRQWDAPSGWTHNVTLTSRNRFLPEPSVPDPFPHLRGRLGVDASSRWYYWKLRPELASVWSTVFVWLCYLSHQLSIWMVTYLAQLHKARSTEPKYTTKLNKYNWICLALNMFFHVLHVIQTHTTYDGLAPELTVTTPQSSAIMLFIWVLVLEYSERGLLFYWPTSQDTGKWSRRFRLNLKPVYLARKYHSYMFGWAAIHTVWYHPMENTYGHILGFYHTWLFLLQGSLMYTKLHQNRWLRLFQEVWVGVHGGLVALQTGGPDLNGTKLWPMFTFGAFFMLVFTWIFILPFWAKVPAWTRGAPLVVFIACAVGAYSQIPDSSGRYYVRLQEVIRFPLIFYFGFLVAYIVLYLFSWVDEKVHGGSTPPETVSATKRALYITGFFFVYAIMVAVSSIIQVLDLQLSMFISMALLLVVYTLGSALGMLFIKRIIPRRKMAPKVEITGSKLQKVVPLEVVSPEDGKTGLAPPGVQAVNSEVKETLENKLSERSTNSQSPDDLNGGKSLPNVEL